jgi:hypothetical protein
MMVWNPPTTFALLAPLALLPFHTARAVWVIVNVALVSVSCGVLGAIYLPPGRAPLITFFVAASSFSSMLVGVFIGQITFLVLIGVVGALFLIKREKFFWAGAVLFLTNVKPHLVLLVVPYFLIYLALQRKWSGWAGLIAAAVVDGITLFILRPQWISDLKSLIALAPVDWATPTLGGLIAINGWGGWGSGIGFILLIVVPILLHKNARLETAASVLILLTVPTTFFGWSYDQSLLLIPMAQVIGWLFTSTRTVERLVMLIVIAATAIAGIAHRVVATSEVQFIWIPLVWGAIYFSVWRMVKSRPT